MTNLFNSDEELQAKLKENPGLSVANPLPRLAPLLKKHKYNAKRTEYNGRFYDSKKEADHAKDNDLRIDAGDLTFYLTQIPFRLPGGVTCRCDFAEFTQFGALFTVHFVDTKGFDTPVSKLKRKQVKELYGIDIEVV